MTSSSKTSLSTTSNLANLLPTGSVLAFQALTPSFSNHGACRPANRYLVACVIGVSAVICFLSSFTDSCTDPTDQKLYYGFATRKGLYVLLPGNVDGATKTRVKAVAADKDRYGVRWIDLVHASVSLFVFLVIAFSDSNAHSCFFPGAGENEKLIAANLPMGAFVFATFLFTVFPTTRRGIGFSDDSSSSASTATTTATTSANAK